MGPKCTDNVQVFLDGDPFCVIFRSNCLHKWRIGNHNYVCTLTVHNINLWYGRRVWEGNKKLEYKCLFNNLRQLTPAVEPGI